MTMNVMFGIDPGLSGAVAVLADGDAVEVFDLPVRKVGDWREIDARALAVLLRECMSKHPGAYFQACIEKVQAMGNDGRTSAFRFGETSGGLRAVLSVLGIPAARVVPSVWKRRFLLLGSGKDESIAFALLKFPNMAHRLTRKKDDGRAEALLIAGYGNYLRDVRPADFLAP